MLAVAMSTDHGRRPSAAERLELHARLALPSQDAVLECVLRHDAAQVCGGRLKDTPQSPKYCDAQRCAKQQNNIVINNKK